MTEALTPEEEYDYKTFRLLVTAMRTKQKTYFATKASAALRDSKELESKVDKFLEAAYVRYKT